MSVEIMLCASWIWCNQCNYTNIPPWWRTEYYKDLRRILPDHAPNSTAIKILLDTILTNSNFSNLWMNTGSTIQIQRLASVRNMFARRYTRKWNQIDETGSMFTACPAGKYCLDECIFYISNYFFLDSCNAGDSRVNLISFRYFSYQWLNFN